MTNIWGDKKFENIHYLLWRTNPYPSTLLQLHNSNNVER